MALDWFRDLILTVDGTATKYTGTGGENYTVWTPHGENVGFAGGKRVVKAIKVQVDRYTKADDDTVAAAIYTALEASDKVRFIYMEDFEKSTGYHHHIFDCEVLP